MTNIALEREAECVALRAALRECVEAAREERNGYGHLGSCWGPKRNAERRCEPLCAAIAKARALLGEK